MNEMQVKYEEVYEVMASLSNLTDEEITINAKKVFEKILAAVRLVDGSVTVKLTESARENSTKAGTGADTTFKLIKYIDDAAIILESTEKEIADEINSGGHN
ncbi:MAG: hypothetical protein LBC96_09345 [Lachnospiraceae bacterium]|jgi:hypothetical protein|nr:hypothetical protein [Lachnospiraceae bacterium]